MLFVIKLFPEITIKSRPVRRRFIRILRRNLKSMLREYDENVSVTGEWDSIEVETTHTSETVITQFLDCLRCTPGITQVQMVERYPLQDFDVLSRQCLDVYAESLKGRSFAVRCKRSGRHAFTSVDVERHVGRVLLTQTEAARVKLNNPDITVKVEIRHESVFLVKQQYQGLGGFPLGSQEAVLSLISGGFDSAVSTFLTIKRGLITHYCFFNLGGADHEIAVKEVALYLWLKYHSSHRVKFVSVPFEPVVAQLLENIDDSHMGVILKRMMLRAATEVAKNLKIQALVTGESVAQVSSQTLPNLAVIDKVTDHLVLRPLITSDKQDIIDVARSIGTEDFSKNIPEYCGVISIKPTTRARIERIEREENNFDFKVLDEAIANAKVEQFPDLARNLQERSSEIRITSQLNSSDIVVDIRHPSEQEQKPLQLPAPNRETQLEIPFYQLQSRFAELSKDQAYLLYCDKGMMSRLHAAHLYDQGFKAIAVYDPT
jgi:thiamine biosynthesis protein ThiI